MIITATSVFKETHEGKSIIKIYPSHSRRRSPINYRRPINTYFSLRITSSDDHDIPLFVSHRAVESFRTSEGMGESTRLVHERVSRNSPKHTYTNSRTWLFKTASDWLENRGPRTRHKSSDRNEFFPLLSLRQVKRRRFSRA